MTPKVGHYLFASCSAQDYGRIVAVGQDANGAKTIDIQLCDPDDLVDCDEDHDVVKSPPITTLEASPGAVLILRHVQWKESGEETIICNTPGNNCFRCTKLFWLHEVPAADWLSGKREPQPAQEVN